MIAPQAFKGSISAAAAAAAIGRGLAKVLPEAELVSLPLADGGDGTVQALVDATKGEYRQTTVTDPLGRAITATWGIINGGQTAIIEMAAASGLRLLQPHERNPLLTTTYGTGELIKAAIDHGCQRVIIGAGGSATNDGGAGALEALGVRFLDNSGQTLPRGGCFLANLANIDVASLDPRTHEVEVIVAVDVTNPLTGPEGASLTYAPQKGAALAEVGILERALDHFGAIIHKQLGIEIRDKPGAGAAGGLAGGLIAILGAKIVSGAQLVLELVRIEEKLDNVDLVIVGEGRIDWQTAYGKIPIATARIAKQHCLPVIAIVGSIGPGYETAYQLGIDAIMPITPGPMTEREAMDQSEILLESAAERALRLFLVGKRC